MKRFLGRKLIKHDQPSATPRPRYRMSGRLMWTVIAVWVILFLMIRAAFHFPANPALTFLIMFALFFVVLFVVRVGWLRTQLWWQKTRTSLARLIVKLFYKNRG